MTEMEKKQYTAPLSDVIMVGPMGLVCRSAVPLPGGDDEENIDIWSPTNPDTDDSPKKDDDGYSYGD